MQSKKIIITGAAGFIGSFLAGFLNEKGFKNLILVDDFSVESKQSNWQNKQYLEKVDRNVFPAWLKSNGKDIACLFHLGARTDTAEKSVEIFETLNFGYSKQLWILATEFKIPFIYASSAATYGAGEKGYNDDHIHITSFEPLNAYGQSKQDFDIWALGQAQQPPFWAGLKFFNVYGPNEFHKDRMASVVYHAFRQISKSGKLKLFRSHRSDFKDGEQKRDFIYVRDITEMCFFLFKNPVQNGIYNAGTGKARTFLDLAQAVFSALGKSPEIEFIDTPEDIRDSYQYFTQADMQKFQKAGFSHDMTSLEKGVEDYVKNYLATGKHY